MGESILLCAQLLGFACQLFARRMLLSLDEQGRDTQVLQNLLMNEFDKIMGTLRALQLSKLRLAVSQAKLVVELITGGCSDRDRIRKECETGRDAAKEAFGVVENFKDKLMATKVALSCCVCDPSVNRDPLLGGSYAAFHLQMLNTLPEVDSAKRRGQRGFLGWITGGRQRDIAEAVGKLNASALAFFTGVAGVRRGLGVAWMDDEGYFSEGQGCPVIVGQASTAIASFDNVPRGTYHPKIKMWVRSEISEHGIEVSVGRNGKGLVKQGTLNVVGAGADGHAWFDLPKIVFVKPTNRVVIQVKGQSSTRKEDIKTICVWMCKHRALGTRASRKDESLISRMSKFHGNQS